MTVYKYHELLCDSRDRVNGDLSAFTLDFGASQIVFQPIVAKLYVTPSVTTNDTTIVTLRCLIPTISSTTNMYDANDGYTTIARFDSTQTIAVPINITMSTFMPNKQLQFKTVGATSEFQFTITIETEYRLPIPPTDVGALVYLPPATATSTPVVTVGEDSITVDYAFDQNGVVYHSVVPLVDADNWVGSAYTKNILSSYTAAELSSGDHSVKIKHINAGGVVTEIDLGTHNIPEPVVVATQIGYVEVMTPMFIDDQNMSSSYPTVFSICMWMRVKASDVEYNKNGQISGVGANVIDNKIRCLGFDATEQKIFVQHPKTAKAISSIDYPTDVWFHVAGTIKYDSPNRRYLYQNGVQTASLLNTAWDNYGAGFNTSFGIGCGWSPSTQKSKFDFRGLFLFNVELSEQNVADIYALGIDGDARTVRTGCQNAYMFNNTTGDVIDEQSGFNVPIGTNNRF